LKAGEILSKAFPLPGAKKAEGAGENEKRITLGMGGDCRRRIVHDPLLFRFSLQASLFFRGLGVSFLRAENVAGFPSFRVIDFDPSWIHPRTPVF
jgi:hypothetical protein